MLSPRRLLSILPLPLAALAMVGCTYVEELKLPVLTEQGRELPAEAADEAPMDDRPEAMNYPADLPLAEPLDIEVVRIGNAVRLLNRTVHSYEDVRLWLNQDFGARIERIPVGHGDPIALSSFVNRHGEPYPVGRFLTPDADRALVMADLVMNGRIHKLTVRLGDDWREP